MKRKLVGLMAGGLVVSALAVASVGTVFAGQAAPTPVTGGTIMNGGNDSGMMGSGGTGGMMGTCDPTAMMGNGSAGGMMGGSTQGKVLTMTQAQQSVQRYIARSGNKNLALDEILEFQRNFYAIVRDQGTGQGAFEVLVNKVTGAVFPEYGPAMMWNTEYGMMGGMMGYQQPSGPMTVSPAQATRIARRWLAQHQPGATTETPDRFPGYYTLHILRNGKVTGMLSVNGYSGQVWSHTWHGTFTQLRDLHA